MALIREYDVNDNTYFAIEGKTGRLALVKSVPINNGIVRSSCDGIYEGIQYLFPNKRNNECYYRTYHKPTQYDDTYAIICPTLLGQYKGVEGNINEEQVLTVALDTAGKYLHDHKKAIKDYQAIVLREYRDKLTASSREYNPDKYYRESRDYHGIMYNLDHLISVAEEFEDKREREAIFTSMIIAEKYKQKSSILPLEKVSN